MNTTTLKQLFNKIEQFAANHGQIKECVIGTSYKVDTKTRNYPLLLVTPKPGFIKNNALSLTLDILALDILDGEEANMQDVWSDMLLIITDVVAFFGTLTGYPDMDLRLDESNVYIEPLLHVLDNECAGYAARCNFIIPIENKYCAIPQK